jgi:uncharacterized protein YjbI with pentapeptide repeats
MDKKRDKDARFHKVLTFLAKKSGMEAGHPKPQMSVKWRGVSWRLVLIVLAACSLAAGGIVVFRRIDWLHVAERLFNVAALAGSWSPPLLPSLLVTGIVAFLVVWKLPALQVARLKALTDENRFDRENEARKTVAQILGGVFVLAGVYSSVQTLNLSREGQITDRFTKAIEQIGAVDAGKPKLEVRLGGIYALERVARDSERDHRVIMEVLTTYVREHSPRIKSEVLQVVPKAPRSADIQAIITVLGRRNAHHDEGPLNLSNTDLSGTDLRGGNFSSAIFSSADLSKADLSKGNLAGSDLSDANLHDAFLQKADLSGANLSGARINDAVLRNAILTGTNLRGASLYRTRLHEAILWHADLMHADLRSADLTGADLEGADISEATLGGASLIGAHLGFVDFSETDLSDADLSGADLTFVKSLSQDQIDSTRGNALTKLPPGLKKPDGWSQ